MSVIDVCLKVLAELRAAALDPAPDFSIAERRTLAGLAAAVEAEVARRAGGDPGPSRAAVEAAATLMAMVRAARQDGGDA